MFVFPVSKAQKIHGAAILLLAKLGAGIAFGCKSRRESCRIPGNSGTLKASLGANPEIKQLLPNLHWAQRNQLTEISRVSEEPLELQGKFQPS